METPEPTDLSDILGLDKLKSAELGQSLEEMATTLVESVTLRALPLLTPHEREAFDELLLKPGTPEEMYDFLNEHVSGLEAMAKEEAARMHETLARVMAARH